MGIIRNGIVRNGIIGANIVRNGITGGGGGSVLFDNTFKVVDSNQDPTLLSNYDTLASGVTIDYQKSDTQYISDLLVNGSGYVVPTNSTPALFNINSSNSDGILYQKIAERASGTSQFLEFGCFDLLSNDTKQDGVYILLLGGVALFLRELIGGTSYNRASISWDTALAPVGATMSVKIDGDTATVYRDHTELISYTGLQPSSLGIGKWSTQPKRFSGITNRDAFSRVGLLNSTDISDVPL